MHYCFLTSGTWEANASFVRLREFGNELLARGHSVSCIADDYPYNVEKLPAVFNNKASIHIARPSRGLGQIMARRRLVKQIKPDYVHVLNPFIKAYMALRLTGTRIIGDWDEWPAHRNLPFARKAMEKFLDRWLRKHARRIVVASKYLQQEFKQRFHLDAAYIPYAAYLQPHEDGESPFTEPTAVYMGNLYPAYDHDLLFEAARILKSRGQTPKIAILGMGPDLEKWRAFVKEHDLSNVSVPGFVSGELLWRYLRHAHVLLFPIRENLLNLCRCPSKTFAYAQTRRPVIANRVGEVAQVLGDKGTYVNCTAEAFSEELQRAMATAYLPDVDYKIENHKWSFRTDNLLSLL
ncbi:MAG TPA: glycosyltransferase [Tepidisphaeraceae bacterium]|jgi:glycosyltransferase involved in cell wall biosynthesis|nr:glycosyltransferase [Tepidisphaeraceae bacterium]